MDHTSPKVTVYMPCYNYARFLGQAIRSVLVQTLPDWELIIINDGSTDNTLDLLRNYENDPRIRIIEQENKGLNVSINIALRLANGKYIIRLDADDCFDENILLVLSNILETKPEVGLVYPDYYHINERGEILETVRRQKIGEEVELLDLPAHGACTMIRKECMVDLKGYDEAFSCQDGYDLWLKFIRKYKPYNVNIPLFYYRQHGKNLSKKMERILETRGNIKKIFIDKYGNGYRPRVLGVIPVVGQSIYSQSEPFVELAGKPLIWYTLDEVQRAKSLDQIVLASEDDSVLEYTGKQFPGIVAMKRPEEFARATSRVQDTITYVMDRLKENSDYEPDAVCVLYISTPLRRAGHIDKAIDTMAIFDVDSVISIQEELAFCYRHRRFGLSPVHKSRRNMRIERDAIYKENGAIYLSKTRVFKNGRLLGKKIGHISMLPWEGIKINSAYEFWLVEKILQDWRTRNEQSDRKLAFHGPAEGPPDCFDLHKVCPE